MHSKEAPLVLPTLHDKKRVDFGARAGVSHYNGAHRARAAQVWCELTAGPSKNIIKNNMLANAPNWHTFCNREATPGRIPGQHLLHALERSFP
jgi:hypothetical protein